MIGRAYGYLSLVVDVLAFKLSRHLQFKREEYVETLYLILQLEQRFR